MHTISRDISFMDIMQTALGVLASAADESGEGSSGAVLGVPSDASLIEHPDRSHAPATVVGVDGECKV